MKSGNGVTLYLLLSPLISLSARNMKSHEAHPLYSVVLLLILHNSIGRDSIICRHGTRKSENMRLAYFLHKLKRFQKLRL